VGVAMVGYHALVAAGLINPAMTIYAGTRVNWLSALVGGLMFGLGMVLASGCGSKTLVRIGSGSLKSLVVFVVMGFSAYATLKGLTAVVRHATVDTMAFDLALGGQMSQWFSAWGVNATLAGALLGLTLMAWALLDREFRRWNHVLAALGIGLCVVAMWWVSGHLGFVPEHPQTLEAVYLATPSGRIEAMSFTAPMAYTLDWLMLFSDSSKTLSISVVAVFGVVCGSALCALTHRSFRWEGFSGTRDTALHLCGAVLMGVGGVTALGCTVGQGLSGLSTLSLTSMIAVLGIVLGALLGFHLQNRMLDWD
jgi:uncharacterized protein